jgi:hypothetical protein
MNVRGTLGTSFALLLAGCASVETETPLFFPSVCLGEITCEARKNAETLSDMGFPDAGLVIMCRDANVRDVLEVECGPNALPYS